MLNGRLNEGRYPTTRLTGEFAAAAKESLGLSYTLPANTKNSKSVVRLPLNCARMQLNIDICCIINAKLMAYLFIYAF